MLVLGILLLFWMLDVGMCSLLVVSILVSKSLFLVFRAFVVPSDFGFRPSFGLRPSAFGLLSAFGFTLGPLPTNPYNRPISPGMTAPAFPQRRILVVDDEPFVCEAVKMMLAFDGHEVEVANSAQEALAKMDEARFDVIITDFAMPVMKGDELAAIIKKRDPKQPVILITAYAEMLQSTGNPLTGVDFVISKPFLLENLREALVKVSPPANPKPGNAS
jgi:CheY-like chemotaxis protein